MPSNQIADDFLRKYHMHYESIDMAAEHQIFLEEMKEGLEGSTSSLYMLPTYISVNNPVPYDQPVIVVDAGGTNFRVAVLTFRKGQEPLIEQFQKTCMPGTNGAIAAEEFFGEIVDRMLPVLSASDKVGFCFSYPSEILPNKDGRLLNLTKEVNVSGVAGKLLGENLNHVLQERGLPTKSFVVLNDTVAAMLGGIASLQLSDNTRFVGFIYGTGLNTCYPETAKNITKSPDAMAQPGKMIINMESGGYSKFPRGVIDREFDATTSNPDWYQFEKMSSGAYFGGMLHHIVQRAIKDALFSPEFADRYHYSSHIPMVDLNDFCEDVNGGNPLAGCCHTEQDRQILYHLIDSIACRTACMTAIHFGAVFTRMQVESSPDNPIIVTAEGTTFQRTKVFRKHLDNYTKTYLAEKLGFYCRYDSFADVTLLGAAVAGLLE